MGLSHKRNFGIFLRVDSVKNTKKSEIVEYNKYPSAKGVTEYFICAEKITANKAAPPREIAPATPEAVPAKSPIGSRARDKPIGVKRLKKMFEEPTNKSQIQKLGEPLLVIARSREVMFINTETPTLKIATFLAPNIEIKLLLAKNAIAIGIPRMLKITANWFALP